MNNQPTTEEQVYNVVFVSGTKDMSEKTFIQYYVPVLQVLIYEFPDIYFVLSDDDGCAVMTQLFLKHVLKDKTKVTIFGCNKTKPKNFADKDFLYSGDFKTIEERNAAMTRASNLDVHYLIKGKGRTECAKNICRRYDLDYDYEKYYNASHPFWSKMAILNKINQ